MLFDGAWQPVTSELTFAEGDAQDRVDDYISWRGRWLMEHTGHAPSVRLLHGDLEGLLAQLLPLETPYGTKWLFIPLATDGPYRTMVVSSRAGGTQASSARSAFWTHGGAGSVVIASTGNDPSLSPTWAPLRMLTVYYALPERNWRRIVGYAPGDRKRWDWFDIGTPLPFERTEHYKRRRIVDRFPEELLLQYAAELGLRPYDADFYAPDRTAWMLVEHGSAPPGQQELTLEQARDPQWWQSH